MPVKKTCLSESLQGRRIQLWRFSAGPSELPLASRAPPCLGGGIWSACPAPARCPSPPAWAHQPAACGAVRCGAVPSWHLGRCFRRLLLPWRARGRGFYCERSSSLLRFRGSEEAGPGPTAGTLQTPQKSLAHLGSSWLREGSCRLTDPLVPSPRPPLTAPPAEHPRAKRAPGSYRGAPWPLEGCGPSVRETRIQESLATCCARDGLGAPEERVQLPRRTW